MIQYYQTASVEKIEKINNELNQSIEGIKKKYSVQRTASSAMSWVAVAYVAVMLFAIIANDSTRIIAYLSEIHSNSRRASDQVPQMDEIKMRKYDEYDNLFRDLKIKNRLIAMKMQEMIQKQY